MQPLSVEAIYQSLRAKSVILGEPRKGRMASTGIFDLNKVLSELVDDLVTDKGDTVLSLINQARADLRLAEARWERYNSVQLKPSKEPTGTFAERINREKALIRLYTEEAAVLRQELSRVEAKRALKKRKPVGSVKVRDGVPYVVDGIPVVDGRLPDGETLDHYMERILPNRMPRKSAAGAAQVG